MSQTTAQLLGNIVTDFQINSQKELRLADSDSSNYVSLKSPATVGSNVVWTLPGSDGSANQYLKTNGSGVLSWGSDSVTPADGSITAAKIAVGAVGASEIATDAVGAAEISSGAVGSDELASGSVISAKIGANAVDASKIAANAVGSSEIAGNAVASTQIAANSVSTSELKSYRVSCYLG